MKLCKAMLSMLFSWGHNKAGCLQIEAAVSSMCFRKVYTHQMKEKFWIPNMNKQLFFLYILIKYFNHFLIWNGRGYTEGKEGNKAKVIISDLFE